MATLKRYRIWRTATVKQFKEIHAIAGLEDNKVLALADLGGEWKSAVISTDGGEVEHD